jgi:hypothetical protein
MLITEMASCPLCSTPVGWVPLSPSLYSQVPRLGGLSAKGLGCLPGTHTMNTSASGDVRLF